VDLLWNYLSGVLIEGLLIGIVFWAITYVIMESTSLVGALRAGLVSELVGNIPYFWGLGATEPPSILMSVVAAIIFVRMIVRVGELTMAKAIYGTTMTYFVLVAVVACDT
jgi:hypothetical protein